jgi:hypothetical protein
MHMWLLYIKNNEKSYMFRSLRDHHQGLCPSGVFVWGIKKVIYTLMNPDFLHIM